MSCSNCQFFFHFPHKILLVRCFIPFRYSIRMSLVVIGRQRQFECHLFRSRLGLVLTIPCLRRLPLPLCSPLPVCCGSSVETIRHRIGGTSRVTSYNSVGFIGPHDHGEELTVLFCCSRRWGRSRRWGVAVVKVCVGRRRGARECGALSARLHCVPLGTQSFSTCGDGRRGTRHSSSSSRTRRGRTDTSSRIERGTATTFCGKLSCRLCHRPVRVGVAWGPRCSVLVRGLMLPPSHVATKNVPPPPWHGAPFRKHTQQQCGEQRSEQKHIETRNCVAGNAAHISVAGRSRVSTVRHDNPYDGPYGDQRPHRKEIGRAHV